MKQPWMKFYPSDWRSDPALRMCSIAARGLWAEMICIMHEANPYGHLVVNGVEVTVKQLASLSGCTLRECVNALAELESCGVFRRTETGLIFSLRMKRDKEKAEKDKQNGANGGNPALRGVNPPVKGEDKAQKPEAIYQIPELKESEGDAPPREPLVSREAIALCDDIAYAQGLPNDDMSFVGLPMRVQCWLAQGIPRDFILATCARFPGKHQNYLDKAVTNGWREHQDGLKTGAAPNGRRHNETRGNILPAADRLAAKIAEFDRIPGHPELIPSGGELRSGAVTPDVRLLSKG